MTDAIDETAQLVGRLQDFAPDCTLELRTLRGFGGEFKRDDTHLVPAAYARLALSHELSHRTIYLDGDTLVLSDLAALYSAELSGNPIGAARDYYIERTWRYAHNIFYRKRKSTIDNLEALAHLWDMNAYFNSGVMVMDFGNPACEAAMSEICDLSQAAGFHNRHRPVHWDQDWLNFIARGRVTILPSEWNSIWKVPKSRRFPFPLGRQWAYWEARKNPRILHYAGMPKPWNTKYPSKISGLAPAFDIYQPFLREAIEIVGPVLASLLQRPDLAAEAEQCLSQRQIELTGQVTGQAHGGAA